MKLAPHSFATTPNIFVTTPNVRDEAKERFANGEAVILNDLDSPNHQAVVHFLSMSHVQKDVAVGAAVGGAVGMTAGVVINQITQSHPVIQVAGEILLSIFGAVLGGAIAQENPELARQVPVGKALDPLPTVKIDYDSEARQLIAQLVQQPTTLKV